MRRAIALLLALALLSGCASVHTVDLSSPEEVADLNSAIGDKTILIRTVDGYEIPAEQVEVAPEVTTFVRAKYKLRAREMPTRSIFSLVEQRKWGLVGGAARGIAVGGAVGAAVGYGTEDLVFSNEAMALYGALWGGLLGLAAGVLLAPVMGDDQVYRWAEVE